MMHRRSPKFREGWGMGGRHRTSRVQGTRLVSATQQLAASLFGGGGRSCKAVPQAWSHCSDGAGTTAAGTAAGSACDGCAGCMCRPLCHRPVGALAGFDLLGPNCWHRHRGPLPQRRPSPTRIPLTTCWAEWRPLLHGVNSHRNRAKQAVHLGLAPQ